MDSISTINPPEDATQPGVPFPDPTAPSAAAPVAAAHACANCGAGLAADQRYCLVCGERNGDPRLPVMSGRESLGAPGTRATTSVTTTSRGPRGSANTALIAGVGTLLVALGVGVVIGRSSDNDNSRAAAAPQVITVGAPAAGAVAGATSGTTPGDTSGAAGTTAAGGSSSGGGRGASKSTKNGRGDDRSRAAASRTPGNGRVAPRKGSVVRVGQRGSGKGYRDGKFTGDFFGG